MKTDDSPAGSAFIDGTGGLVDDGHGLAADSPMEMPFAGWRDVGRRVSSELRDDHSSLSAAGTAFFGFLALVPGLASVVSVYGLLLEPGQVRSRVQDLFGTLPLEARRLVERELSRIAESAGGSLSIGLAVSVLLALWSASSGVMHLLEAIGIAYDQGDTRGFVRRRVIALLFTLAGVLLAVVAVTGLAGAHELSASWSPVVRWLLMAGVWIVVAGVAVALLAAMYRFGPDRHDAKWRWVTPGSVVAVALGLLLSVVLQVYVANFGSYDVTYGSLAAVVVLLLWLFLSAFAVLIGAQLNAELEHQTAKDSTEGAAKPLGERGAVMADTVASRPT